MAALPAPRRIRFEHRSEALGIGTAKPRISWEDPSTNAKFWQTAIEIKSETDSANSEVIQRVDTSDCVLLPWPFEPR